MSRDSISKEVREEVRLKFGGFCAYCGIFLKKSFHVDHVIPVASGGVDDICNYFPACAKCNGFKSDWELERFRQELERQTTENIRFVLALRFAQISVHPTARIEFHYEKLGHRFDSELVEALMERSPRVSKERG